MAAQRLKHLITQILVLSIPEFARKANISEKTMRNTFDGNHKPRERTKRDIIAALNEELAKKKMKPVGLDIFD